MDPSLADLPDDALVPVAQSNPDPVRRRAAFRLLFRRHERVLFTAAFRHLARAGLDRGTARTLAEEVVQEVFLAAGLDGQEHRYFLRFQGFTHGPDSFRRFLQAFRHRLTANAIRKHYAHRARVEGERRAPSWPAPPMANGEARASLRSLEQSLSADDWAVLALKALGHDHHEIGRLLDISVSASRQRVRRARARAEHLREGLDGRA